jgi:hypothetical protein
MTSVVEIQLLVQDEQASDVELLAILQALTEELVSQSAEVDFLPVAFSEPIISNTVKKGDSTSNLLDVKSSIETLRVFVQWLYARLIGTTTKVEFKFKDIEFKFEGNSSKDYHTAMQDFEQFIVRLESVKRD